MSIQDRIDHFSQLGKFLFQFTTNPYQKLDNILNNDLFFDAFQTQIKIAKENNGWFTNENIMFSFQSWSEALRKDNLINWTNSYTFQKEPKRVAVIMAGNIPLVGFHDFLSVLLSGNKVLVKQSSNDRHILPFLIKYLEYLDPEYKNLITVTNEKMENFDAVIATGSNNTARYFEYYFKNKPSIIRKNRNSVAVLTGKENGEELKELGKDIFTYFGLGCRNVSKLFVPKDYNFDNLFQAIYDYGYLMNNPKYMNNYDYNKAVYLMSQFKMLENGFLILKEDTSYSSPIGSLFYENYEDLDKLKEKLTLEVDQIQCIVGNIGLKNEIDFGQTQLPKLTDYADGVDTMRFLQNI